MTELYPDALSGPRNRFTDAGIDAQFEVTIENAPGVTGDGVAENTDFSGMCHQGHQEIFHPHDCPGPLKQQIGQVPANEHLTAVNAGQGRFHLLRENKVIRIGKLVIGKAIEVGQRVPFRQFPEFQ